MDLLGDFPKCIKIRIKKSDGEIMEKWIRIIYGYVPKYYNTCMIQGHDEKQYVKYLKLFKK